MTWGIRPYWTVAANSVDITTRLTQCLLSLKITDTEGDDSDSVEITAGDPGDIIDFPEAGAELAITMGYDGVGTRMGRFIVDEVEVSGPPTQIRIKASSAPFASENTRFPSLAEQKRRSWDNVTIGSIVRKIASEHSLTPLVSPALESTLILHEDQTDKSDVHFLNVLAKQNTALVKVADGKLVFAKAGESKFLLAGTALPDFTIAKNRVTGYSLTSTQRQKWGSVVATYRDVQQAKDIDVTAGSGSPTARIPRVFPDADTARRAAESRLRFLQRSSDIVRLELPGEPKLAAEGTITLSASGGWRPEFAGQWVITTAEHTIDNRGFRTSLDAILPPD